MHGRVVYCPHTLFIRMSLTARLSRATKITLRYKKAIKDLMLLWRADESCRLHSKWWLSSKLIKPTIGNAWRHLHGRHWDGHSYIEYFLSKSLDRCIWSQHFHSQKCKSYLNFVSGVMKSMPGRKFWDEKLYRKCNYAKESHSICKNWDLFTYHKENAIPLLPPGKRSV